MIMTLRLTEQPSLHDNLEKKSVAELLREINEEDKKVPLAIEKVLPDLERLVSAIERQIRNGGRMFYCGAGTGGKLRFVNVNDGTCEGIKYKKWNCFTVQFHPEANGGPKDTEFLFDQFVSRMLAAKGVINNA